MNRDETFALAAEFMAAVRAGDPERLAAVYADDVRLWHTFDGLEQTKDENIRTLIWMFKNVRGLSYDDIRVAVCDGGFVQQFTMRAEEPAFEAPCIARLWCADGLITRLEEYVDSAHTKPLTDHIAAVRATRVSAAPPAVSADD